MGRAAASALGLPPAMPTVRLASETMGLAPVAQITLLPAASLLLVAAFPL